MQVVETSIRKILTRTSGYLQTVSSHSMQPYQGCSLVEVDPAAVTLDYRDRTVSVAQRYLPGRVGVNIDGFAGRYLPAP